MSEAVQRLASQLQPVAGDAARIEARWLIEAAGGDEALLARLVERRLAREPVDRIIGSRGFWTLDLVVTPDVLSPRADSETLIRAALDHLPKAQVRSVLDLGTGSGALLLAMLAECPEAQGVGVDLSPAALAVAKQNAKRTGLSERCRFIEGSFAAAQGQRFDRVLSNPPYIPTGDIAALDPEVRAHDPHLALNGGVDGLAAYRGIVPLLQGLLTEDGVAILEIGVGQAVDVVALGAAAGLSLVEVRADYGGIERAVVLKL
jgi:release factor glutamine methyltransferase